MPPRVAVVWKADTYPEDAVVGCFREVVGRRGYHMPAVLASFTSVTQALRVPGPPNYPNVVLYCIDNQEPALIERQLASVSAIDPGVLILLLGGNFDPQFGLDCLAMGGVREYFAPGSQRQIHERVAKALNPLYSYAPDDLTALNPGSNIFVAMSNLLPSLRNAVDTALDRLSLTAVHADDHISAEPIRAKAFRLIQESQLVLACVDPSPSSGSRDSNVYVEIGFALAKRKPRLFCIPHAAAKELPAYISDIHRIEYDDNIDLAVQICRKIKVPNARPRPDTAAC